MTANISEDARDNTNFHIATVQLPLMRQEAAFQQCVKSFNAVNKLHTQLVSNTHLTTFLQTLCRTAILRKTVITHKLSEIHFDYQTV